MSLSNSDWTRLENLLDKKLNYQLEKRLAPLEEKISHLPTKEQFYKKMDKWMKAASIHDLEKAAHKRAHERLNDHLAHAHVI